MKRGHSWCVHRHHEPHFSIFSQIMISQLNKGIDNIDIVRRLIDDILIPHSLPNLGLIDGFRSTPKERGDIRSLRHLTVFHMICCCWWFIKSSISPWFDVPVHEKESRVKGKEGRWRLWPSSTTILQWQAFSLSWYTHPLGWPHLYQ